MAIRILDRHLDIDAVAHALSDDAEVLELLQDAFEVLVRIAALGQPQFNRCLRNAPAALGIALGRGADARMQASGLVLVLAQRERQAGNQAVGNPGQQQSRGVRPPPTPSGAGSSASSGSRSVPSKRIRKA